MKYKDYIEKKQRGTRDFPLGYYFVNEQHQHYVMPLHWHSDFEIIRAKKGTFKAYLENVEYNIHTGEVLLVAPGCLHRVEPEDCIYECIVFKTDMLIKNNNETLFKTLLPFINSNAKISQPHFMVGSEISNSAKQLFAVLSAKKPFYEFEVYSELFKIFYELFSIPDLIVFNESLHTTQAKNITALIDWIENNINEDISLKKLSEISGFSEKYLCKIFKQYTSKTIVAYINELRIERACYDMKVLGKNVTDAAFDNGYNDLSYFCKIFKKHFGITPNEFRKTNTKNHPKNF